MKMKKPTPIVVTKKQAISAKPPSMPKGIMPTNTALNMKPAKTKAPENTQKNQ